jgi:hypothetical protein
MGHVHDDGVIGVWEIGRGVFAVCGGWVAGRATRKQRELDWIWFFVFLFVIALFFFVSANENIIIDLLSIRWRKVLSNSEGDNNRLIIWRLGWDPLLSTRYHAIFQPISNIITEDNPPPCRWDLSPYLERAAVSKFSSVWHPLGMCWQRAGL